MTNNPEPSSDQPEPAPGQPKPSNPPRKSSRTLTPSALTEKIKKAMDKGVSFEEFIRKVEKFNCPPEALREAWGNEKRNSLIHLWEKEIRRLLCFPAKFTHPMWKGTMRDRSDKKESERRREWNRDRGR